MDYLDDVYAAAAQRWAATEPVKSERDLLKDQIVEAALKNQQFKDWEVASICPVEGTGTYVVSLWRMHEHPDGSGGNILLKVIFVKWDVYQGYIGKDADRL